MDDQAKSAKRAEDFIRYTTKNEVKQRDIKLDDEGRICVDKHKSIKIDHVALATQFIKLASVVPGITTLGRHIIQKRLMNPGISTAHIGLSLGMRDVEVLKYEREGLNRIKQFIGNTSFQEVVSKANRDNLVTEAVKNLNLQGDKNSLLTSNSHNNVTEKGV